jgi:hypothetical protein
MWLKLIIALVLVIYIMNKISMVLFRVMGRQQPPPPPFGRTGNGTVNNAGKQTPKRGGIKGGEYVDYEEVK